MSTNDNLNTEQFYKNEIKLEFEYLSKCAYSDKDIETAMYSYADDLVNMVMKIGELNLQIKKQINQTTTDLTTVTKPKSIFDNPLSLTLKEFNKRYKSDDDCLQEMFHLKITDPVERKKYKRVKGRLSFINSQTNEQLYPLKDTIFEATSLPLLKWFTALFNYKEKNGKLSAKELALIIDVSYKTALRVLDKVGNIRLLD
jgi:ketosteroid isomerase-like protein